jgi:uncharacterized protein YndB with AHSA1/START domain
MDKPRFVYVTYIATTPQALWRALTDPDVTEKYWLGYRFDARGAAGGQMTGVSPAGIEVHRGDILESDPPRRLVYGWHSLKKGLDHERPSRVSFDIEAKQDHVKLTVIHDDFDVGSKVFNGISQGWPIVLSNLKGYLESGTVVHMPACEEAAQA